MKLKCLVLFALVLALAHVEAFAQVAGGETNQTNSSLNVAEGQSVAMGEVAPSEFSSLRGKNLLLRRDQGAIRLQTPILYEDLKAGSGSLMTGVERQEVTYQAGIVDGLPLLIRIDVPVTNAIPKGDSFVNLVEPAVERLIAAIDASSSINIQKCAAGRVCTKICSMKCCEWRCK